MKEDKSIKKSKKVSREEEEKKLILAKADEVQGEQLVLIPEGVKTEKELTKFTLQAIDNPEQKYSIYYMGLMKLLRNHLPKGVEYKEARKFIYEEKNTFLTRGKRIKANGLRGADSRMAYITEMEEFLSIVTSWIISKGTMLELFTNLRDINIEKGYGGPKDS
jgi:hypothetical protein